MAHCAASWITCMDQWELPIDTLHGITRAYWAAYRHSGETVVDSGSGADVNT